MTIEYTTRVIIRPNGTCFAEPPKGVTLSHREALYKQCAEKCNGFMTIITIKRDKLVCELIETEAVKFNMELDELELKIRERQARF